MLESTPLGAFATSGTLPLKRFRLGASPATGLVGLQENAFLSDFFGCAGFLPLTTKSHIRETMVKVMTSPAPLPQSASGADCDAEGHLDAIARGAEWIKASERNQLPMDPSTCTFWCAIALGALAKGSPIDTVSTYCELAQEALAKSNSGPANVKVAKAWVILAYLCCFMGDMVGFQEYLALSDSFLTSCIEQGSADILPVGFAEIVKHNYSPLSSRGHQWQMKSYRSKEEATPPQLKGAITEVELYQYVAQSYRAYEQILHQIASNQIATTRENVCDEEFGRESDSVLQSNHVFQPREVSDAIGTFLKSVSGLSFEPVEEAVDRPSVRGGFGGLLINLGLVFPKAAKGDMHAALERIGRCVEVCERYPGLCRSTVGCHMAHLVLVSLAAIGGSTAQAMYDRMRASYNSFRPTGSRPAPNLEEWNGVGAFCDDSYCRAMDLVASELKGFSAPSVDSIDTCVEGKGTENDKGETVVRGGWQTQSGTFPAWNIPEKDMNTVHDWLTEGETECCSGPPQASAAPITSPISSAYQGCGLKTVLHSDRVESKVDSVDIAPARLSRLAGMSDGGAMVEDAEEDSIGAENWLDVTHGMLDAL
ncbi:unnamed protein product [Ectocarpus sp. 6 AP-2014]